MPAFNYILVFTLTSSFGLLLTLYRRLFVVVDCTAEPDESKKLEKAVHDALNVNGDNAGYAFWIAGEDGRYKLAQWCDTSSPRSKGIVGQYPDPVNKPDDLPENFSWGVKF